MLTAPQQAVLRALADTVVAAVPAPPGAGDPTPYLTAASDVGADVALVAAVTERLSATELAGLAALLDAMALLGFARADLAVREAVLATAGQLSPEAGAALAAVSGLARLLAFGLADAAGHNPFWSAAGYPGPPGTAGLRSAPDAPARLLPVTPAVAGVTLTADVVVVGSGAGGAVAAAVLAQAGRRVVLLEAGQYRAEADFSGAELDAYASMYWRGGPTPTVDGNVSLLAGATLGGGTTVNWTNWVPTYPRVRAEWAAAGLSDVAGPEFDRHLDLVAKRVEANSDCDDENGLHQMMRAGAEALGWSYRAALRNTDRSRYSADSAGYLGFGDASGAKLGALATFLPDAVDAGAQIVTGARVRRVLVESGRAVGVQADVVGGPEGATLSVRAATVVLAAGALETPAVLLRSGIGGPAAGDHLRLHPCAAVSGIYPQDLRCWWGAPQVGLVDEFSDLTDGYGFLVEGIQYAPALAAAASPWRNPRQFKALMARAAGNASFIALTRDRGHGRVSLGPDGEAVVSYPVEDALDRAHLRAGVAALCRLHEAAGAEQIVALSAALAPWRRGQPLEPFIEALQALQPGAGGLPLFSAHQMGTARMGTDPQTSVCDPRGQLHDTSGVWVADTSAYPTATGGNPMATCMALAHRTAENVLADRAVPA